MCRNTSFGKKKGRSMIWNLFLMVAIIGTVPETGELGSICLKKVEQGNKRLQRNTTAVQSSNWKCKKRNSSNI